jgi:ABC-type lipoprotein release transport system permease subunit
MVAAGAVIGVAGAWALRRVIETQLFGVGAFHVPTVAAAGALLGGAALAAAVLPAWRASRVDPHVVLRAE